MLRQLSIMGKCLCYLTKSHFPRLLRSLLFQRIRLRCIHNFSIKLVTKSSCQGFIKIGLFNTGLKIRFQMTSNFFKRLQKLIQKLFKSSFQSFWNRIFELLMRIFRAFSSFQYLKSKKRYKVHFEAFLNIIWSIWSDFKDLKKALLKA